MCEIAVVGGILNPTQPLLEITREIGYGKLISVTEIIIIIFNFYYVTIISSI